MFFATNEFWDYISIKDKEIFRTSERECTIRNMFGPPAD